MATTDTRAASESEYQEILRRLERIEDNEKPEPLPIPLIDPTANVLKLVEQANVRQDDLRTAAKQRRDDLDTLERYYQRELRDAESKRIDAERKQEQNRVDSVIAALQSTITTLTTQIVATATTLATQAKEQNETTTAAIRLLEQKSYERTGIEVQRGEGRQVNQWAVGLVVGVVVVAAEVALRLSGH